MIPIYLDLHIHTSENANVVNDQYDVNVLIEKIKSFNGNSPFLISFTDHNTINKSAYLKAVDMGVKLILGVELHIKYAEEVNAYHCHIFFNVDINENSIDKINDILDDLYPEKLPERIDSSIPDIQKVINSFDDYDIMLLPHAGQGHGQFNYSLKRGERVDDAINRSIYYNQFDGFTARSSRGLEATKTYFDKLGIGEFINLLTGTDNYSPNRYPEPKSKEASEFEPTWMLSEPTFDGLRLALSESSRLVYQQTRPIIESEHIKAVRLKNEMSDIDVTLTEGLNVVIGGSSSGKTLFVDSLYRAIKGDFEGSVYNAKFGVENIQISNPSGMLPHYISQNFISENISNNEEKTIDKIDLIQSVFPPDRGVTQQITKALSSLKETIVDFVSCVKEISIVLNSLKSLPHPGRLVTYAPLGKNVFSPLLPTQDERESYYYSNLNYSTDIKALSTIQRRLQTSPFVEPCEEELTTIKAELTKAFEFSNISEVVRRKIIDCKDSYDSYLEEIHGTDQERVSSRDRLKELAQKYVSNYRRFVACKQKLISTTYSFKSRTIKVNGNQLTIVYNFQFNEAVFLETLNHYLHHKFNTINDVVPENIFSSKFRKKPNVSSYDDLAEKIYHDLAQTNTRTYEIVDRHGKMFNSLSPGWKTAIILDLVLGYSEDHAPIIIDQPEDNLAVGYINDQLVKMIKDVKRRKQVILVSHNATIPMMADAQNVVVCFNTPGMVTIRSAPLEAKIGAKKVLDYIALTDGGRSSIKKRVKKYNLKKFSRDDEN